MRSEVLLLLSGIASDEAIWADQVARLDGTVACRCLVARGETIDAMAEDVIARAPSRFALAGHSMGGYIALAIQRRAPERVERLALINTSPEADTETQRIGRLALIGLVEAQGYNALIDKLLPAMLGPAGRRDTVLRQRLEAMLRRAGPARFIREQRAVMARSDSRAGLDKLCVPTLIVSGSADRIVPWEHGSAMASRIPGAKFMLLQECGHMAPAERPSEISELLAEWNSESCSH